jgi:hypothetical protein
VGDEGDAMSRSGYSDDLDPWDLICWRGAVASAIRGRRGQAFLREMLSALDTMPTKRLIESELVTPTGEVCAIGAVCAARGLEVEGVDETDREAVGELVGIAPALAAEIAFLNDDECWHTSPESRWALMRSWVAGQIVEETP